MYIDDIRVVVEGYDEPIVVEGYDDLDVGNVLSCTVTGLLPDTQYLYHVRAYNGSMYSLSSPDMAVTTSQFGAVTDAMADASFSAYATGGNIMVKAQAGSTIEVYTTAGTKVADETMPYAATAAIAVPQGIYIVKCGTAVTKVIVP